MTEDSPSWPRPCWRSPWRPARPGRAGGRRWCSRWPALWRAGCPPRPAPKLLYPAAAVCKSGDATPSCPAGAAELLRCEAAGRDGFISDTLFMFNLFQSNISNSLIWHSGQDSNNKYQKTAGWPRWKSANSPSYGYLLQVVESNCSRRMFCGYRFCCCPLEMKFIIILLQMDPLPHCASNIGYYGNW